MGRISSLLKDTAQYSSLVKSEVGGSKLLWEAKMLYCFLRYGAKPVDYWRFQFWRKSASECNKYLTSMRYSNAYKRLKRELSNNNISGDKFAEYRLFAEFIKREWIEVTKTTPDTMIESFIQKHYCVIAKPNKGEQGKGVMKIFANDKEAIHILLRAKANDDYVLEECLVNTPEISKINPSSLNTIRATTFVDKNGDTHILSIILRVGAPGSHVDNWGAGGVGYNFDVETGICNCMGLDKKNHSYICHPGSNFKMVGFELPDYTDLKKYVLRLVKVVPQAWYVGWDIAITPNGYDLIEMNCPAGHDMFQSFNNPVYRLFKHR